MSPETGAALMALVGVLLAQQAPLNRGLSRATGAVPAAFVNFAVGLALIFVACLLAGQLGGLGRIGPDWWHALGGLCGASYVLVGLLVVRRIGASGVAAGTVTGQLFSSVAIDAGGLLGIEQRSLEWRVLLGAAAVLLGTYLVAGIPWRSHRDSGPHPARETLLPLAAMAVAGALVGIQIPLNGLLAESTGDLASGLLNFITGGTLLLLALLLTGTARGLAGVTRVRWVYLGGGLCGAVNALVALSLVDQIGAGTVAAATVTGQLLASLAIDRAGLFDLEPRPLDLAPPARRRPPRRRHDPRRPLGAGPNPRGSPRNAEAAHRRPRAPPTKRRGGMRSTIQPGKDSSGYHSSGLTSLAPLGDLISPGSWHSSTSTAFSWMKAAFAGRGSGERAALRRRLWSTGLTTVTGSCRRVRTISIGIFKSPSLEITAADSKRPSCASVSSKEAMFTSVPFSSNVSTVRTRRSPGAGSTMAPVTRFGRYLPR